MKLLNFEVVGGLYATDCLRRAWTDKPYASAIGGVQCKECQWFDSMDKDEQWVLCKKKEIDVKATQKANEMAEGRMDNHKRIDQEDLEIFLIEGTLFAQKQYKDIIESLASLLALHNVEVTTTDNTEPTTKQWREALKKASFHLNSVEE